MAPLARGERIGWAAPWKWAIAGATAVSGGRGIVRLLAHGRHSAGILHGAHVDQFIISAGFGHATPKNICKADIIMPRCRFWPWNADILPVCTHGRFHKPKYSGPAWFTDRRLCVAETMYYLTSCGRTMRRTRAPQHSAIDRRIARSGDNRRNCVYLLMSSAKYFFCA